MALLGNLAGLARSLAVTALARRRRGPLAPGWTLLMEALFAQVRRELDAMAILTPEEQRARMESMTLPSPIFRRVQVELALSGGVRGEWITPRGTAPSRRVLFIHGGGYVTGGLRGYRELAARIALEAQARVFSLEYRLAPEHPFPAAADDALAALRFLIAQGDPATLALAGDSAGGALCAAALVAQRDSGGPLPACAALLCPWMDVSFTAASIATNEATDLLGRPTAERWCALYLNGADQRDPRASPVHADLRGLPPLLVQVGALEMALDDATAFAGNARTAGVQVTLEVEPAMPHDWHLMAAALPQARASLSRIGQFVRAHAAPG